MSLLENIIHHTAAQSLWERIPVRRGIRNRDYLKTSGKKHGSVYRVEWHGLLRNSSIYISSLIMVVDHDPQILFNDMVVTTAAATVTAEKKNSLIPVGF